LRQRQPENAKAIRHADAEMNAQRCGWDKPSIEPRRSDNALAIEKTGHRRAGGHVLIESQFR